MVKMIFFNKCTIYMEDDVLVIHERYKIVNAFKFSITIEEYCQSIVNILYTYCQYSKQDLIQDIGNIVLFIKMLTDTKIENYELALIVKRLIYEMEDNNDN